MMVAVPGSMAIVATQLDTVNEEACGVPRSSRLRDTTEPTFQISMQRDKLTIFWDDPKTARAAVSPTFHTNTGEMY
jgi:hypothetical protein